MTQLWLQDKVRDRSIVVKEVGTDEKLADALTKGVNASAIAKHVAGVGTELGKACSSACTRESCVGGEKARGRVMD